VKISEQYKNNLLANKQLIVNRKTILQGKFVPLLLALACPFTSF
jgi:hypothetical protein